MSRCTPNYQPSDKKHPEPATIRRLAKSVRDSMGVYLAQKELNELKSYGRK